jgi:hypothetical protein
MEGKNSKKYCYTVIEETMLTDESREYLAYGVRASLGDTEIATVSDVTTDGVSLTALVKLCNEEALDIIHMEDVIQDFLAR